jgi:hypothetical protein
MRLLRPIARLVAFLLLLALALAGLAAVAFAIQGGHQPLSGSGLAHDLHLPQLRDAIGGFLDRLEAPGPVAAIALLGGAAAVLAGLLLIVGIVVPPRSHTVSLRDGEGGRLAARRRPLAQVAKALVTPVNGVEDATVRVRPSRGGARLTVKAIREDGSEDATGELTARLEPLAEPFGLRTRVRTKTVPPIPGAR